MSRKPKKENPFYKNKTTLTVYLVLRGLVIFVLIRSLLRREYQSMFLCALSLVLMVLILICLGVMNHFGADDSSDGGVIV